MPAASKIRSCLVCLLNLMAGIPVAAQTPSLVVNGNVIGSPTGVVRIFDPITEAQRKANAVEVYSDIQGSYFWDNEWRPALVVLRDGRQAKLKNVKLNQYTSEIHFVNETNGNELVAKKGIIKQITFFDKKDSTRVTLFDVMILEPKNIDSYCEVLNPGQKQLLKRTVVNIKRDNGHSVLAPPESHFVPKIDYYLKDGNQVNNLKGLNKNAILSLVSTTKDVDNWLHESKNKLRNEAEIIAFLNYSNAK